MNEYRFDCEAWIRVWARAETEAEAREQALALLSRLSVPDVRVEWDRVALHASRSLFASHPPIEVV